MRHATAHLPAFLCLLIPLGIIAWLGSSEIRRQDDRTERAMLNHASSFVREAARQLDEYIHSRCELFLDEDFRLEDKNFVLSSQQLNTVDARILDLLILNPAGDLTFPSRPPSLARSIPFHRSSTVKEINQGEELEALDDIEGAKLAFESALAKTARGPMTRRGERVRAHLALGGIHKKRREYDSAEDQYLQALNLCILQGARWFRDGTATPNVALLCELALTEIHAERDETTAEALDLMRSIARAEYNSSADGMLEVVMQRLSQLIPVDSEERLAADAAMITDGVRRVGRQFASEYHRFLRETIARRINQGNGDRPIYQIYNSADETSLLTLRRVKEGEAKQLSTGTWIGVRLDLELMLGEAARHYLAPDEEGFYLDVRGPEGGPILSSAVPEQTGELRFESPTIRTDIGLHLRALLMNPQSYADARATSSRNRNLLALVLFLTALGGAFLLVRSTARAAELATMKIDFVSRVSHELKTPLSLIKMYSETIGLGRTKDQAQRQKFAGIIAREADHLTTMIERILDFSRQEAGTAQYERCHTDLSTVLNRVTDAYQPHVESRGGTLQASLEDGIFAVIDANATERAVVNLLENAVKYSPVDSDKAVELVLKREGETAMIEVLDRGVGIPSAEHTQIFSSFYRASNASEVRGAGLGLSLVAHFAEAHGGTVTITNREGGGSIFQIQLPCTNDDQPHCSPPTVAPQP